jgi:C-terminal processing protease CtpA/Prc
LGTTDVTPRNSATSGQNTLTSDGRVTDSRIDGRFTDDRSDDRFTDRRTDSRFTDSRTDSRFTDNRTDDRFTDDRVDDRFTDNRQDDRFTDNRGDDRFTDRRTNDRFTDSRVNDRFPSSRVTDSNGVSDEQLRDELRRRGVADDRLPSVGETMSTEGGRPQLGVTFYDSLTSGATIATVLPDTAADRAGLRRGDQILSINGRRFDDYRDAFDYIDVFRGSRMDLVVKRDGEHVRLAADLTTRPLMASGDRPELGLWFSQENGFEIGRTANGSIAYNAGLRSGDRVVAIDGQPVTTQRALTRYLADLQPNERVNIDISRNGRQIRLDSELMGTARDDNRPGQRNKPPAARMAERETREYRAERAENDRDARERARATDRQRGNLPRTQR